MNSHQTVYYILNNSQVHTQQPDLDHGLNVLSADTWPCDSRTSPVLLMTVRWCFIHVLVRWCCWHTSCLQSGDDSVVVDHRCVYWAHAANNWWRRNTPWKINHRPVIPVSVSRLGSEITLNALVSQKEFRAFVKGQFQWCHSVVKLHCNVGTRFLKRRKAVWNKQVISPFWCMI